MTMTAKCYANLKQAGLPWLDQVPSHWRLVPNRFLLRQRKVLVGGRHRDFQLLSLTKQGVILRDVESGRGKFSADMGTSQEVRSGDLVFCLFDVPETPRTVGLSRHDGMITGAYSVFECPDRTLAAYLDAFYRALDDRKLLSPIYSGLRNTIPMDRFLSTKTPVPPPEEQAAIVRYLDHVDRRIRRYIAAKKKLIALLNEQKQVTINSAVTRGLDPSVRLKPSGVEWLGDIPAHWEVVRAKRLFSPRRDLALPGDVQLSATQAYGVIPQAEFEAKVGRRVVKISMHLEQRRHVEKGDFVISMRSFQGGLERAWASGAIRSSYVVLKRAPLVDVGFFSYLFKSRGYIRALQATADFIRDGQDLNFGNFCDVGLPLVPLDEQKAIAASISGLTAEIDVALAHTEREIALVREYRARLISDVVTGRLDVREAAERLPDEPEQPEPNDGPDAMTDTDDEIADDTNAVGEQVEV